MCGEFRPSAEPHALCLRVGSAPRCTLGDAATFELSGDAKHSKDKLSKRRADAIRHLGFCRYSAVSWGRRRERSSLTIELRGTRAKEADCIRPALAVQGAPAAEREEGVGGRDEPGQSNFG